VEFLQAKETHPPRGNKHITVVIVGATGYLGLHILARLIDPTSVMRITCLVRPSYLSSSSPLYAHPKVHPIAADLSQAALGLDAPTFAALASKADIVLHCVANCAFWDGFESLRNVDFDAVKDLVKLCVANDATLHFMSSGAVDRVPPVDGSDGYIASKWAAENLLNQAAILGLKMQIHRPVSVLTDERTSGPGAVAVKDDLMRILLRLKKRPDFSAVSGYIDVARVHDVSASIAAEMREASNGIAEHRAQMRLRVSAFAEQIEGNRDSAGLEKMKPLLWFAEAKKAGFAWLIIAMELVMRREAEGGGETSIVTRR
jgi:hybrid polyketide synthase/nonribosomal peptide synthetase ACE1